MWICAPLDLPSLGIIDYIVKLFYLHCGVTRPDIIVSRPIFRKLMKNMKIGPLYATASLPIPSHHISSHSISYPFLSQNDEFLNRNLLEAIDKIMRVPSSWCCHRMTALWLVFVSFTILPEVTSFSSSASTRIPQEIKSSSTTSSQVGFYVHIPYCRRRCRYCNFAIVPIGNGNNDKPKASSSFLDVIHAQYQADLFQELDSLQPEASLSKIPLASIYFGGGTPSLAPVEMIQGVLQKIRSKFEVAANVEITMEMDPGTFDLAQLCALKELGMNRISLGVQSFDDTILEQLGRVHRRADIDEAVKMIHQVFGEESANYSMDLISGVPGLTEALWIDTLQTATNEFAASHLSIYDLQVEEGTVFGSWYHNNKENMLPSPSRIIPFLPTEDSVARMYKFTAGYLRAKGFEHYEGTQDYIPCAPKSLSWMCSHIKNSPYYCQSHSYNHVVSSYAQRPSLASDPSRRSRHNQIYWASSSSWYAIGLGATSCVNGKIQARPKTMVSKTVGLHSLSANVASMDVQELTLLSSTAFYYS